MCELNDIYEKLRKLKENLFKLSLERRTPERLKEKLNEATIIYNDYSVLFVSIRKQIDNKTISGESLSLVKSHCDKIVELNAQIQEFCSKLHLPVTRSSCEQFGETSNLESKMEFNLKIALSLLPVMNNEELTTHGIEYYSSTLKTEQCKLSLINFVLKSRLSQQAKLSLKSDYPSIDALLTDMRMILLPKKSAIALQNKLQTSRQDQRSINDYGSVVIIFKDTIIVKPITNLVATPRITTLAGLPVIVVRVSTVAVAVDVLPKTIPEVSQGNIEFAPCAADRTSPHVWRKRAGLIMNSRRLPPYFSELTNDPLSLYARRTIFLRTVPNGLIAVISSTLASPCAILASLQSGNRSSVSEATINRDYLKEIKRLIFRAQCTTDLAGRLRSLAYTFVGLHPICFLAYCL
ncbi:hypothetical protein HW555_006334 [Spodoptera exigua]|uniref:Uncharacterized protein n=1 Tax=Spodoptera exigua TaxID=7107 RepID=A0A835GID8_SPOEX|nr:hypothetical protein HW555_006334 [Spodoptera exigua]